MGSSDTTSRITAEIHTTFEREYRVQAPDMRRLYENAKRDQWNASRDIDWNTTVDLAGGIFADELIDVYDTEYWNALAPKERAALNVEYSCWRMSQLLHGETGAMLACSQLVNIVPGNDAKFFQATQVVDEARHAEVLGRYLLEKCGGRIYPIAPNISRLFEYLLGNGKWFIKTVGLQLIAETFAVSLFRMLSQSAKDATLREIARRILADEARHMGFSVLSLPDEIRGLNPGDLHELEDFTREALMLVMGGQFPAQAYEAVGFSAADIERIRRRRKERAMSADNNFFRKLFRRDMATQVVGNMAKVGLINARTSAFLRDLGMDPEMRPAA
jgi:P-aminobenzoate N-oxygenase AurF